MPDRPPAEPDPNRPGSSGGLLLVLPPVAPGADALVAVRLLGQRVEGLLLVLLLSRLGGLRLDALEQRGVDGFACGKAFLEGGQIIDQAGQGRLDVNLVGDGYCRVDGGGDS